MSTPFEILGELDLDSWRVLRQGLQRGWIDRKDVTQFAVDRLAQGPGEADEEVLRLAIGEDLDDREFEDALNRCALSGDDGREEDAGRAWRLARMLALARSGLNPQGTLDQLQLIYAEFGYPEDMRACSPYFIPPHQARTAQVGDQFDCPLEAMADVIRGLADELGVLDRIRV